MKKRLLSFGIALCISAALLTGCGGNKETSSTSKQESASGKSQTASEKINSTEGGASTERTTFTYVVPGDEPKDLQGGLDEINKALVKDNVGIELALTYFPWDAWDQKINLMLSTGEKFDAFQVMNDRVSLSNYASRGALASLDNELDTYGKNILDPAINPETMIKSVQVDGKTYAIPTYWVETALDPEITIRKDLLKKYGQKEPKTFEELTSTFEAIMNKWEGAVKPFYPAEAMWNFGLAQKTYEEWPFVIYDQIFFVDEKGNVQNVYETEVFKRNAKNARTWYEKGLISPDILTTTADQKNNQLNAGDWFVHGGTIGDITPLKANYPDLTSEDFINLDLAPEKPRVRPYGTRNMNAVPLASEHPEAAVKFFNWILENQENYDLFMYGREGIDYEKSGERFRTPKNDPVTNLPPYYFSDWMAGNINFIRTSENAPASTNAALYTINETAVESPAAQFTFNAEKVQTQLADVQTQIAAEIKPIASGVKDYDENIEAALAKLKAAGIDDLIAEFKLQLEASKAGN